MKKSKIFRRIEVYKEDENLNCMLPQHCVKEVIEAENIRDLDWPYAYIYKLSKNYWMLIDSLTGKLLCYGKTKKECLLNWNLKYKDRCIIWRDHNINLYNKFIDELNNAKEIGELK